MKKTNLVMLASVTMLLASCGGSGKIRDIVDFTPKLTAEASGYKIVLPQAHAAQPWVEGAGWINAQPHNFIADVDGKFSKHSVSKSRMIASPVIAENKIFTLSENGILSAIDITPPSDTNDVQVAVAPSESAAKKLLSKLSFGSSGKDEPSYKLLWSADLKRKTSNTRFAGGAMSYRDGILFLTHGTRDVIAFDAAAGMELWRRRLPDVVRLQPVLFQNAAILQTLNNQTYAMDINSGRILWQHDGLPETLSTGRNIAPIVHKGIVVVGYSSGQLVALNLANGQELWQMNLSREGEVLPGYTPVALESQPVVDGDSLYVASGNGFLIKVNMANGSIQWQHKVHDIQAMNKAGNAIFVTNNAKQVAALATDTGRVIWATDLDPIIEGKKPKSRKPAQFLTPIVANGKLIIVSSDGKIRQLSVETGEVLKTIDTEKGAQFITVGDAFNVFTGTNVLSFK